MKWSDKGIYRVWGIVLIAWILTSAGIAGAQEKYFSVNATHSFNAKQMDLSDFLRLVARTYGVNLLYENVENRKITVALENVDVNELLTFIIKDQKLDAIRSGTIVKLFPAEAKLPIKIDIQSGSAKDAFTVVIENAPLDDLAKQFTAKMGTNVTVAPHLRHNRVSLTATNMAPDKIIHMLALQEGIALTQEDGFFHFADLEVTDPNDRNMVIKIDQIMDDQGSLGSYILTAKNAPLSRVCSHLFDYFEISHVFVDRPTDVVNLRVQAYELDQILGDLMASTNATYFRKENVFYIGNKTSEAMKSSELIGLSHLQVTAALEAIPENLKKELTISEIGMQNSLLVTGKAALIQELKEIIRTIDLPVAQVLIEVLVVDFNRSDSSEFGLNISNGQNTFFPGLDVSLEANRNTGGNWQITRLPSNFMVRVQALAEQGVARIISKPHIATLNGVEASIIVGEKRFYKVTSELLMGDFSPQARTTEQIKDIEANIELKIKPFVTATGEVSVDIEPNFNTFLGDVVDNVPPPISYRNLKSTVRLQDGQTIILGGLIQETITRAYRGLPWISKIPIIGNLFKNHDKQKENAELVMYITPHVYYGDEGSARVISHDEGMAYNLDVRTQYEKEKGKGKYRDEDKEASADPATEQADSDSKQ